MAFNKDSLVIEKLKSCFQTAVDGSIMWRADQLSDPTLSCSGEVVYSNDAEGTPIAAFYRNPGAAFSATNAVFSTNLFQNQIGATRVDGTAEAKISVPCYEMLTVTAEHTATVGHTPKAAPAQVYLLNKDKSIAETYVSGAASTAGQFAFSGTTITLPESVEAGSRIAVFYEYESENAALITNSTSIQPEEGTLYIEALFCDICQTANKVFGWIVFPRAKLDNNVELGLSSDSFSQPISLQAMKDYCSDDQELFHLILAE